MTCRIENPAKSIGANVAWRRARKTMNARSGASGTGYYSARRRHGPIGAARIAHCHLPPRALPDAQPRQHGAQSAGHHNNQLYAPPTVLITRHQSCAPRGRVRRTSASRFAHASSRLRIAPHHPTCSSFYSTHRSPAYAACCTALCKRHAREPSRGPGQCIWKQDGAQNHAPRTLFPDCESPRTIPHALPFTPLIAHQLVQLVAQHSASNVHESPRAAQANFEAGWSSQPQRSSRHCMCQAATPQPGAPSANV